MSVSICECVCGCGCLCGWVGKDDVGRVGGRGFNHLTISKKKEEEELIKRGGKTPIQTDHNLELVGYAAANGH